LLINNTCAVPGTDRTPVRLWNSVKRTFKAQLHIAITVFNPNSIYIYVFNLTTDKASEAIFASMLTFIPKRSNRLN